MFVVMHTIAICDAYNSHKYGGDVRSSVPYVDVVARVGVAEVFLLDFA